MRKKVLVVDGNSLTRKTAMEYLSVQGFEAADCKSPIDVLAMLSEFRPDVVLLDMEMPGFCGGSIAEVIRKHITLGDTRIVSFSASEDELLRGLLDSGLINGYFSKNGTLNGLADVLYGITDADGRGVGHS